MIKFARIINLLHSNNNIRTINVVIKKYIILIKIKKYLTSIQINFTQKIFIFEIIVRFYEKYKKQQIGVILNNFIKYLN